MNPFKVPVWTLAAASLSACGGAAGGAARMAAQASAMQPGHLAAVSGSRVTWDDTLPDDGEDAADLPPPPSGSHEALAHQAVARIIADAVAQNAYPGVQRASRLRERINLVDVVVDEEAGALLSAELTLLRLEDGVGQDGQPWSIFALSGPAELAGVSVAVSLQVRVDLVSGAAAADDDDALVVLQPLPWAADDVGAGDGDASAPPADAADAGWEAAEDPAAGLDMAADADPGAGDDGVLADDALGMPPQGDEGWAGDDTWTQGPAAAPATAADVPAGAGDAPALSPTDAGDLPASGWNDAAAPVDAPAPAPADANGLQAPGWDADGGLGDASALSPNDTNRPLSGDNVPAAAGGDIFAGLAPFDDHKGEVVGPPAAPDAAADPNGQIVATDANDRLPAAAQGMVEGGAELFAKLTGIHL